MGKIKLFLGLIIFVFVVVIGYWISFENNNLVRPVIVGFELPEWNLGTWLFIALLMGGLLGYVISMISYLKLRARAANLQRKLKNRDQEILKLRSATPKE